MKKTFNPLVSIIIPVYNGSNYLNQAIDSALSQSYKNIEIIVVNDGSSDDTENIAKSYGNKIKYYYKENGGVASALNFGISKMQGEYFSWLSHDDIYREDKVKNQVDLLVNEKDKETVVNCLHSVIDKDYNFLYDLKDENNYISQNKHPLFYLFNGFVHGCSLLIHKNVFKRVGVFNENLPTTQDFDLWFRIFRTEKLIFSEHYDVLSRSHEEQGSKEKLDIHINECDELWKKMVDSLSKEELIDIYGNTVKAYYLLLKFLEENTLYRKIKTHLRKRLLNEIINEEPSVDNKVLLKRMLSRLNADNQKQLYDNVVSKKTKPRLAFGLFGPFNDRGGLNRAVINIANGLCEHYDIHILTSNPTKGAYKVDERVNVITGNFPENLNNVIELLTYLQIDIYVNLYNCLPEFLELSKNIKEFGIKVIIWNHEFYFLPYYNPLYVNSIIDRNVIYRKSDLVLWLTYTNQYIYSFFGENGMRMENALTIDKTDKFLNSSSKNIISVGRFDDPRKNLEGLILVLSELNKIDDSYKLYVVGDYDLNMKTADGNMTLAKLIEKHSLNTKNLIFVGHTKDINSEYAKAALNIVTSYHEGFGLMITEAASYGIPTIAFDDSGFQDMIENGKTGYLVNRDYFKMAKKIHELMSNKELYFSMRKKSYAESDRFDYEKIIKKWLTTIDIVLNAENASEIEEKIAKKFPLKLEGKEQIVVNGFKEYEKCFERILKNITFCETSTNNDEAYINEIKGLSKEIDNILENIVKPLEKDNIKLNNIVVDLDKENSKLQEDKELLLEKIIELEKSGKILRAIKSIRKRRS